MRFGLQNAFGWTGKRLRKLPIYTYIRQLLVGNDGSSAMDKLDIVNPEPVVKHVGCLVVTSNSTIVPIDGITTGSTLTHEGTALFTLQSGQVTFTVGTIGMISIDGVLTYTCQEINGVSLISVNPLYPDTVFDATSTERGFSDLISSNNLKEGFSFVEQSMVFRPAIDQIDKVCAIPYHDTSGKSYVDWGDGSGIELLNTANGSLTYHMYPEADEEKYTARVLFGSNARIKLGQFHGARKIFNSGGFLEVKGFTKLSIDLNQFILGDFDATKLYSIGSVFRDHANLISIDFSAPRPLKVLGASEAFKGTGITELDATNIDFSLVDCIDGMFASCFNLRRIYFAGCDFSNADLMRTFMANVTLDTETYSQFLIEIAKTIPPPRAGYTTADFGFSKYAGQEAIDARAHLESLGWVINDGGLD